LFCRLLYVFLWENKQPVSAAYDVFALLYQTATYIIVLSHSSTALESVLFVAQISAQTIAHSELKMRSCIYSFPYVRLMKLELCWSLVSFSSEEHAFAAVTFSTTTFSVAVVVD